MPVLRSAFTVGRSTHRRQIHSPSADPLTVGRSTHRRKIDDSDPADPLLDPRRSSLLALVEAARGDDFSLVDSAVEALAVTAFLGALALVRSRRDRGSRLEDAPGQAGRRRPGRVRISVPAPTRGHGGAEPVGGVGGAVSLNVTAFSLGTDRLTCRIEVDGTVVAQKPFTMDASCAVEYKPGTRR